MALRDKLETNAQPYLRPGEVVQETFLAQTMSGWFALISPLVLALVSGMRVVVCTNERILICTGGRFLPTKIKDVRSELPRSTRIGPPKGLWYRCESLDTPLYIHRRFHADVRRADELATAAA